MKLKPLIEDVDVREYSGRFNVQLEIPSSSTLSSQDIDKIGYLASWDIDPNEAAEGYEGLRSILVSREFPIMKKGIELGALQISGIGSKKPHFVDGLVKDPSGSFEIPSKKNYMGMVPGTIMSTSYAKHEKLFTSRPDYRAFGTYTTNELKEKLQGTNTASGFELEKMLIPHVEAYGRYLDKTFQNEEGPFGFIVFPVPSVNQERMATDIVKQFSEALPNGEIIIQEAIMAFYTIASLNFAPVIGASRELHDKARYAHLQLHLSNVYSCNPVPYVMDWSTLRKLGHNKENNLINRAIDLIKPMGGLQKMLYSYFGDFFTSTGKNVFSAKLHELSMELYSENPLQEVDAIAEIINATSALGRSASDIETVIEWMKRQGIEGFPKHDKRQEMSPQTTIHLQKVKQIKDEGPKIGRNEPCPCNSGKKYKKCCGK
jgi:hypothetical protein